MNQSAILQLAKESISIEISELEHLKNRLNEDFVKAVELIRSVQGLSLIHI